MFSDPKQFKLSSVEPSGNWVLRFNQLKRFYKSLIQYFEQTLGLSTTHWSVPNLTVIARESNQEEIVKLVSLLLVMAVQCENNQWFIGQIQHLSSEIQHEIMKLIEEVF
jgi:protein HOOK3